jgi:hypothetical protein
MVSRKTFGPDVKCPTCEGNGTVKLTPGLWRVLTMVEQGYDTAAKVYAALEPVEGEQKVKQTRINNRLEELRGHGLLGRTMRGRQWVYHRTEPKAEQKRESG